MIPPHLRPSASCQLDHIGLCIDDVHFGKQASQFHSAFCPLLPCSHMAYDPFRSMPSTCHRGLSRLGLIDYRSQTQSTRGGTVKYTEADTRVFLTDSITLVVGEEHIG